MQQVAIFVHFIRQKSFLPSPAFNHTRYGLATVRYPVLEVTAAVEPFENGRGFSLRVLRAGKPRIRPELRSDQTAVA
jgi:hypothetical protein